MRSELDQYSQDGYCVFSSSEPKFQNLVGRAFQKASDYYLNPSSSKKNWGASTGWFRHYMNPHQYDPDFAALIKSGFIQECAKTLYGDKLMRVTHSKISFKPFGKKSAWLPHSDYGYKSNPELKGGTMTVFLEDCDEKNGTLEVFPKSHLLTNQKHERVTLEGEKMQQLKITSPLPMKPIAVPGKKGTILCFDLKTVHQSGENHSHGNRTIFIFEMEPVESLGLDEYGLPTILLNGRLSFGASVATFFAGRAKLFLYGLKALKAGLKEALRPGAAKSE